MKVGIHKDYYNPDNSFIKKYERILHYNKIEYEWMDINKENFWEKVKSLDLFIFRWRHFDSDKILANTILPIIEKQLKVKVFPDQNTCWHFDDKIRQYYLLKSSGFPYVKSWIFWNEEEAVDWINKAEFPKIFKLKGGAGSTNVIKIKSKQNAIKLTRNLFRKGIMSGEMPASSSIDKNYLNCYIKRLKRTAKAVLNWIRSKKDDYFWQKDKNYIMFQEFLDGNKFDTRITVIGNRAFGFRRMTRKNDFRASGSGKIDHDHTKIDLECVKLAFKVSNKFNFQSMAYDFIYNTSGGTEICEISYTFQDRAVYECSGHWDIDLNWHEGHLWPQYCQLADLLKRPDLIQPDLEYFDKEKKLKIAVITQAPFPEGMATTNRVIYHAKGLIDNDVDTKVFISMPTERRKKVKNPDCEGNYKGIEYKYVRKKNVRSKFYIKRRIDDILGPIATAYEIIRNKYDGAVLISFYTFYPLFVLKFMFLFSKVKFIAERTEMPFHNKRNDGFYKIKNKFNELFAFKTIKGFVVISHALVPVYRKLLSENTPIRIIPIIIDVDDIYIENIKRTMNIVYMGPLTQYQDGILTIIDSFKNIEKDFPETKLICTGELERSKDKNEILRKIDEYGIRGKVIFKGFIPREEMVHLINTAGCLVLAKPSSIQADTCFPTKLGEYLATGNPVVVTKTGEIPRYLQNEVNAYVPEPDNVEDFTFKLRKSLSDREKAVEIGKKGQDSARVCFSYIEAGRTVKNMILDLKK
ncbi:MAG TPA: glycosyltransferase [Clostridiales bacterium]|nr:glycosyltransferase [Clostridiales bacterium]HQP69949.1 glycosyltransferase [Clostridiales bacterium]